MDYENLTKIYKLQLEKSIQHLEYSHKKVLNLETDVQKLNEEELETWEGFMARFARSCDIFLSKYIRARVSHEDPGFSGTFRDYLNYAEEKLGNIFASALKESKHILNLKKII